jgi:hypothetical protein
MARPKIVDLDYFLFRKALRKAIDSGSRIDRADKTRWKTWVQENHIKEAAFQSFAKRMYEGLEPVIIDGDPDYEWRGYYLFSTDEEAVLKWVREPES